MATIEIANGITFTASEETIAEYQQICKEEALRQSNIQSAWEERDWEDIDDYYEWGDRLHERLLNLGA